MVFVDAWVAAAVLALVAILVAERRAVAEIWLRNEDGRTLAALRIATGVAAIAYVSCRAPLHGYLLTDEGLFFTDIAQQVHAKTSFAGYGSPGTDEPSGFFDVSAFVTWLLRTNHSLLLFRSDPAFVQWHIGLFYVVCGAFTIGLATPVTKWLTWFLLLSILQRSYVAAAGEQVLMCTLVPLVWSRCGEVWSVDRWLRRRHEPPSHVPAWPRWLIAIQTLPMLTTNGLRKWGDTWADGDSLWYVLQHPDFVREWASGLPQLLGPGPLRVATWAVHGFEVFFPLVLFGLVATLLRDAPRPGRAGRIVVRVCAVVIAVGLVVLDLHVYPREAWGRLPFVAVLVFAGGIAARAIVGPRATAWIPGWVFGRKLWVGAGIAFGVGLSAVLDIGLFTWMVAVMCLAWLSGDEIGRLVRLRTRRSPTRAWREPPARAPWRRRAVLVLSGVHLIAMGVFALPRQGQETTEIRKTLIAPFVDWNRHWWTHQHWMMFAPNVPRSSLALRVTATRDDGTVVDLGAGFGADPDFELGLAWDRGKKIERRLTAQRSEWYRKWHARYVCRTWALHHGGTSPAQVGLYRRHTRFVPPPDRELPIRAPQQERLIHQSKCARDVAAQNPPHILRRHGLDPSVGPEYRPWKMHRYDKWKSRGDAEQ